MVLSPSKRREFNNGCVCVGLDHVPLQVVADWTTASTNERTHSAINISLFLYCKSSQIWHGDRAATLTHMSICCIKDWCPTCKHADVSYSTKLYFVTGCGGIRHCGQIIPLICVVTNCDWIKLLKIAVEPYEPSDFHHHCICHMSQILSVLPYSMCHSEEIYWFSPYMQW